jgi:hypothetical protein
METKILPHHYYDTGIHDARNIGGSELDELDLNEQQMRELLRDHKKLYSVLRKYIEEYRESWIEQFEFQGIPVEVAWKNWKNGWLDATVPYVEKQIKQELKRMEEDR